MAYQSTKYGIYIFCLSIIVACSSVSYKPTAFSYEINQQLITKQPVNNLVIATINYGKPSRHYLSKHEKTVDGYVETYLESNKYTVKSSRLFQHVWQKNLTVVGDIYNPGTGLITSDYHKALKASFDSFFDQHKEIDAVVFTNLIQVPVRYGNASNRSTQWHGVMRKVKMQGVGDDFSTDFDWFNAIDGISLEVYIINRSQEVIFHSIGGIQVAQAIEVHNKTGKFVRRADLLKDDDDIEEGINLAFHPFIFWKKHPGFE